jgi:hypothetical protein
MIKYCVLINNKSEFVHFENIQWSDLTAMIAGGLT